MDKKAINEWLANSEKEIKEQSQLGESVFERVRKYNKNHRIIRLHKLSMKEIPTIEDMLEIGMIQVIREENGEIDES